VAAPLPYQETGIDFLAARPVALLADDAGLGKSLQLIRAADRVGAKRLLVLSPAVGRVSWAIQFREWDTTGRLVLNYPNDTLGLIPDGPVALIVTHDYLSRADRAADLMAAMLRAEPFDAVIVDEAHAFKSMTAVRTQMLYGHRAMRASGLLRPALWKDGAPRHIWIATATFTPLNASEFYPHLRALFPDMLAGLFGGKVPNFKTFRDWACYVEKTAFGERINGNRSDAIWRLRAALQPHLLLRTKADVLTQLPPLTTTLHPVEVASAKDLDAVEDAMLDITALSDDDEFLAAVSAAWTDPHYSTRRKALGILKASAIMPWITDFLSANPDRKLVAFAHHRDVIDHLRSELEAARIGSAVLDGRTSAADAREAVDRFQTEPACRVFIGQNRAASTAITLTAASTVLLLEPDPSPAINYQALSRCHRLGQSDNVHGVFVSAARSPIEARLINIIRRRAADNRDLFGVETPGTV
jgi:SNF2 family DNA or RNA helicase